MTERNRNILVGLTVISSTMGFAALMLLFGYVPQWLEKGYVVRVKLNHAGGLTPGSRVRFSGIDVGGVRSVDLPEPPMRGVVVVTFIKPDVRLPKGMNVGVEAQILGGSPTLSFDSDHLDDEQMKQVLATDGTASVHGLVPSLASQFAEELKSALTEPFNQFERFSRRWSEVGEHISLLVEPRQVEQVDAGEAEGNLSTVLVRADLRLAEIKNTLDAMAGWLDDKQLQADIRTTAANAAQASGKLSDGIAHVENLTEEVGQQVDRLVDRYVAVADDLSAAIRTAQSLVELAGQDQGSLGKLLKDPALFNNLNDAVTRISEALKEAQLLIQKWQQEGLAVQF